MTIEEKIARLKTLFAQREEVDKEIAALLTEPRLEATKRIARNKPKTASIKLEAIRGKKKKNQKHPQKDITERITKLAKQGLSGYQIMKDLGLCSATFYNNYYYDVFKPNSPLVEKNPQGVKRGHSKYSRTGQPAGKSSPDSSAAFTYQCDCGYEFKSVWDVDMGDSVHCPKCNAKMTRANKF